MKYQKITKFDTANGIGIRTVLWVSGCSHRCPGCHNQSTWDPDIGIEYDQSTIDEILSSLAPDYISGLTLSGGDPLYLYNRRPISQLVTRVKYEYPHKSIWLYTGYTYESLLREITTLGDTDLYDILHTIDVLVDGKYINSLRDISLPYCGSSNQRVIDVPKSLNTNGNKIILYKEEL